MTLRILLSFLVALTLIMPLACEREGPAERAGERVDKATEQAGEQMEEAGEQVQEGSRQ